MGLNADQIVAWIAARKLSPEARQKLETLAAKKRDLSDATAAIQQLEARINALSADEGRLRQNIQSLNSVVSQRPQVEKWAADLAAKEVFINRSPVPPGRGPQEEGRPRKRAGPN